MCSCCHKWHIFSFVYAPSISCMYLDDLAFSERQFVVDGVLVGRHCLRIVIEKCNKQPRLLTVGVRRRRHLTAAVAATRPVIDRSSARRRWPPVERCVRVGGWAVVPAWVMWLMACTIRRRRWSLPGRCSTAGVATVLMRTVGQSGRAWRRRMTRLRLCTTTIEVLLRLDVETRVRQASVVVASDLWQKRQKQIILMIISESIVNSTFTGLLLFTIALTSRYWFV